MTLQSGEEFHVDISKSTRTIIRDLIRACIGWGSRDFDSLQPGVTAALYFEDNIPEEFKKLVLDLVLVANGQVEDYLCVKFLGHKFITSIFPDFAICYALTRALVNNNISYVSELINLNWVRVFSAYSDVVRDKIERIQLVALHHIEDYDDGYYPPALDSRFSDELRMFVESFKSQF